jgi:hypothetical protein
MNLFNKLFGHHNSDKGPAKARYASVDYNQYFDNTHTNDIPVEIHHLGDLNITSGKIVACDPMICLYDSLPFTKTVQPGKYPVIACKAKDAHDGHKYAIVKLEFSKERATKWEMALAEEQDIDELTDDDECFGFPVDAGLACFCDAATQQLYNQFDSDFMDKNPKGNLYDDFMEAEFRKNALNPHDSEAIGDWLNFYIPDKPDHNVIMFNSGFGDGTYACYWGTTDDGAICSLIIDFEVFYRLG